MEQESPNKLDSALLHTSQFERPARTGDERFAYAIQRRTHANSLPKSEEGVTRTQISLMMNDHLGDEFDLTVRTPDPYQRPQPGSPVQNALDAHIKTSNETSCNLGLQTNMSATSCDTAEVQAALTIFIEQLQHTIEVRDWVYLGTSNRRTFPFVAPELLNNPEVVTLYQEAQQLFTQCYPNKTVPGHSIALANPREI